MTKSCQMINETINESKRNFFIAKYIPLSNILISKIWTYSMCEHFLFERLCFFRDAFPYFLVGCGDSQISAYKK